MCLSRSGLLGLTVATCCNPASIKITDGHPVVVDALRISVQRLKTRKRDSNCTVGLLNFADVQSELYEGYDICLISDCLHTPDLHSKIAYCLKYLLKPGGSAFVFNPEYVAILRKMKEHLRIKISRPLHVSPVCFFTLQPRWPGRAVCSCMPIARPRVRFFTRGIFK